MNKRILPVSALIVVLALAGCAEPSAGSGGEALTKPPALTVEAGGETIQALEGTYSWQYDKGSGTWTGVEADYAHPLECEDIMPALETEESRATLSFAEAPDTVTVHCWSEDCWGTPTADSEDVDLEGNEIALKPGGWIYEVRAEWNSRDWGGTAYASFLIRTPAAAP